MDYRYEKGYMIKEISPDGLLKDPKDIWGNHLFRDSYETEECAIQTIKNANKLGPYVILTVVDRVYGFEDKCTANDV